MDLPGSTSQNGDVACSYVKLPEGDSSRTGSLCVVLHFYMEFLSVHTGSSPPRW